MPNLQEQYDDAMFAFSRGEFDEAITGLRRVLAVDPAHFDSQLSLGMAYYRKGDYTAAIQEGHKAEALNPKEQWVHTNLSLFYVQVGDKVKAEHHGLQARIASWRDKPEEAPAPGMDTPLQQTPGPPPSEFPDMPWKKKPKQKD